MHLQQVISTDGLPWPGLAEARLADVHWRNQPWRTHHGGERDGGWKLAERGVADAPLLFDSPLSLVLPLKLANHA